jgi:hypothetical protein
MALPRSSCCGRRTCRASGVDAMNCSQERGNGVRRSAPFAVRHGAGNDGPAGYVLVYSVAVWSRGRFRRHQRILRHSQRKHRGGFGKELRLSLELRPDVRTLRESEYALALHQIRAGRPPFTQELNGQDVQLRLLARRWPVSRSSLWCALPASYPTANRPWRRATLIFRRASALDQAREKGLRLLETRRGCMLIALAGSTLSAEMGAAHR